MNKSSSAEIPFSVEFNSDMSPQPESDSGAEQKQRQLQYCANCNSTYFQQAGREHCPVCGAHVDDVSIADLQETIVIQEVEKPGASTASPLTAEDDPIAGTDLHVYRCQSLLGRGGMGMVYLATHRDLGRQCALKILLPHLSDRDPEYVERFIHEGRAVATLNHPNIVTAHAIGEERGYRFLEMELITGRALSHVIRDDGPLTPLHATSLIAQVASGLGTAHAKGIIHQDLKLENILLSGAGVPKIADFGLAKRISAEEGGTHQHNLAGTPNYMAPELFQGGLATATSDVYSLGVCFFVLLTGQLPHRAENFNALIQEVVSQPAPSVRDLRPDIPLEISECVSLMLDKSPANRFQNGYMASLFLNAILGQVQNIEAMLHEAFGNTRKVSWKRNGHQYILEVKQSERRKQTVIIEPSEHQLHERLLLIYSTCCDAQPEYYEEALRLNAELSHGGISIREVNGESKFVMVDTFPRSSVDAEDIRKSVMAVAHHADEIEEKLTGRDLH
ncbi:serine/threonine protein kinase [Gimesia panareensis]|uniref:serine/threonine protein kinase n=1 Tax=Gimesia panareensis TaxID=2527978 RepID=UPI00118BCA03|nr:serine/threonine-protein kinase [Gimesia panareensis]QDU50543.1 Serine/threonine-protein kinase PrkC [Gimesia panareensis]